MRKFVAGVDESGHSCLVEQTTLVFETVGDGFDGVLVAATSSVPPPARPPGRGERGEMGLAPGLVGWQIVDFGPNVSGTWHHTDTVDFDMLLEGSLELTLDDGTHSLQPGDIIVVNGVDHLWVAGPQGCRLSVVAIGTPPPG